ncbi:hypothetical protein NKR23_g4898 [Pleurostoma richardsiae]|uniref:Uncharacterized protein n=1 Tax=Pleurostoma richardsiae TaxID=41990 RepID=A0AA38VK08_9PEZI|nr:hypothetical protein NKR23_g4898 [Pleurostoma richardsiae]
MSAHLLPIATPKGQPHCLVLIQSSTGRLEVVYLPISGHETPKVFIATVGQTYKTHVPKTKRLFYRCVFFKKAAVSIAQVTSFTPTTAATGEYPDSVAGYARDTILTDALRKPSVLRGANRTDFWKQHECVVVDAKRNIHPKAAILVHLEDDPVAARVFHIMGSAISLTAAIVMHFAF